MCLSKSSLLRLSKAGLDVLEAGVSSSLLWLRSRRTSGDAKDEEQQNKPIGHKFSKRIANEDCKSIVTRLRTDGDIHKSRACGTPRPNVGEGLGVRGIPLVLNRLQKAPLRMRVS